MKFIILFEDSADADPDTRKHYMAEHLGFLENNADQIEAAGPVLDTETRGRDGMWVVETASKEAAEQLVFADPFWPTGLRASYSILEWKQVFAGGKRLISPA